MAATDAELLLYRRLKAILQAHAPLVALVKANSFIWYDGNRDDPEKPNMTGGGLGTYPFVALEPAGRTEEVWDSRQRYMDHNVNATPASLSRNVALTFNFTIRITHRNLQLAFHTAVESEAVRALRGSNPTLSIPGSPQTAGYAWVRGWGPLTVTRFIGAVEGDPAATAAAPTKRMQSLIAVPVYTLFNSADLLT